jgi:type II secretory pathway component HofQ
MQLSTIPASSDRMPRGQAVGEKRITMSATNADVRGLLVAIASAGDVNLVLSPDVQGRVSVAFKDVPVSEALRRVLTEAGLGVVAPKGMVLPWDPTLVFYQLPVNVDRLSEEAIMARYGVGRAIAEVLVRERKP